MVKRHFAAWMLMIVMIFVAAACSADEQAAPQPTPAGTVREADNEPAAATVPEPAPPAELIIHSSSGWTEETVDERFANAVREKFPHHTITYIRTGADSNYSALITSGVTIDIFFESIAQMSLGPLPVGLEQDMEELVRKYNIDLSVFEPSMIDVIRTMGEGKLVALPFLNNTLSLYYNKDIFDRFGVSYPTDDMTWNEIIELARTLTREEDGQKYYGLAIAMGHMLRLNQMSMPYVDLETVEPTIANERWKILIDRLLVPLYQIQEESPPNFLTQQTVAMQAGLANIHLNNDMSDMNWDVAALPTFEELPGVGPQLYPTYVGVSKVSKHQEQSMEIIQYLVSEEFQTKVAEIGALPAIRTDQILERFGTATDFQDKNIRSVFYENHAPITVKTKYDTEIERVYNSNINLLLSGEIDTNTMMRQAYEEAKLKLSELMQAD